MHAQVLIFLFICRFSEKNIYLVWMYSFSLLANSFSLPYIEETLTKIKIVFCSNAVTYEVTESFEWLQTQFNLLNACNINELIVDSEPVAESDNKNDSEVVTDIAVNPWESHFLNNVTVNIAKHRVNNNPLHCPQAVTILLKKWMPTAPFWSALLLGNHSITVHSHSP